MPEAESVPRIVRVLMAGQYERLGPWAKSVHYRLKPLGRLLKLVIPESVGEAIRRLEQGEAFDLLHLGPGVSPAAAQHMANVCIASDRHPGVLVSYDNAVLMPVFVTRGFLVDISSTRIDRMVKDLDTVPSR